MHIFGDDNAYIRGCIVFLFVTTIRVLLSEIYFKIKTSKSKDQIGEINIIELIPEDNYTVLPSVFLLMDCAAKLITTIP
ncbi:MAG: hypothetical protein COB35_02190 [Gammaproteobacteria bacterium]|nr:MAG: hypothetical protein COB35_02190 [Gammaproteobacteria bacterium]